MISLLKCRYYDACRGYKLVVTSVPTYLRRSINPGIHFVVASMQTHAFERGSIKAGTTYTPVQ